MSDTTPHHGTSAHSHHKAVKHHPDRQDITADQRLNAVPRTSDARRADPREGPDQQGRRREGRTGPAQPAASATTMAVGVTPWHSAPGISGPISITALFGFVPSCPASAISQTKVTRISIRPWLKSANSTITDTLDGHPGYTDSTVPNSNTCSNTYLAKHQGPAHATLMTYDIRFVTDLLDGNAYHAMMVDSAGCSTPALPRPGR